VPAGTAARLNHADGQRFSKILGYDGINVERCDALCNGKHMIGFLGNFDDSPTGFGMHGKEIVLQ